MGISIMVFQKSSSIEYLFAAISENPDQTEKVHVFRKTLIRGPFSMAKVFPKWTYDVKDR